MLWIQKSVQLPSMRQGVRLITHDILQAIPEIAQVEVGLLNLFLQHTSASISINENADPDVQTDLGMVLDILVPETLPYEHVLEGRDDMPAHVKSSVIGVSINVPVSQGRLALGTWQGIYLCEHRRVAHRRTILLTLQGEKVK